MQHLSFIDLFCGIGGFRYAMEQACANEDITCDCEFSSDIDAQDAYEANFGERPMGDITQIAASDIPDHDVMLAGFPCQAFSICGDMRGFEDTRGTFFFDVARILEAKRPRMLVLENVRQLVTHDHGRTLKRIMETLHDLGYDARYRVLNALDFGLPQKRERVLIVGFSSPHAFQWPARPVQMQPLSEILEDEVPDFYYASEKIRASRQASVANKILPEGPSIWHENKSGNISPLPYSCALRAGASYNYLLVNGERRMTEREMLRIQGFPESFKIVAGYSVVRKQAGNSVPVPLIRAVITAALHAKPTLQDTPNTFPESTQQLLPFGEDLAVAGAV